METVIENLKMWLSLYGLKVLGALITLIAGKWLAGVARGMLRATLAKREFDATVSSFAVNVAYLLVMTFTVVAALQQLGVATTSFVAVLGAAGLAVALAFQNSLSNFAAGFLLVLFRPFKKGDFIEGAGTMGIVEEIQVFTTILKTPDNKQIIVPNGRLTADRITNFSAYPTRRIDLKFGISYGDDLDTAKAILARVVEAEARILKEPAPGIWVVELGDSSVNLQVRVWVNSPDCWDVTCALTENVKKAFDAGGISIPFPQRDVHLFTVDGKAA